MILKNKQYIAYKDLFNIYNLIRKINKGYRLYFDKKNKQFVIANINNNFEICYKFKSFSNNILMNLQFSRVENISKYLNKIDDFNENLLSKERQVIKQNSLDKINEYLHYCKRSKQINKNEINKIIEA